MRASTRSRSPAAVRSATLRLLERYESRNVTFLDPAGDWPIVWTRARGTRVWDDQGRQYIDLTSAFGVAATGHANPAVVRAGARQLATLGHAMGDVHPHALKARLARELSRITFERWSRLGRAGGPRQHGKTVFCNSGFEAVEAALKTARLATGRPGVIAFEGAYHGLGYGALNATHRAHFRGPFADQLGGFAVFQPFPTLAPNPIRRGSRAAVEAGMTEHELRRSLDAALQSRTIGAILVEPVQGRGGVRIPPPWFLPLLRRVSERHGALLILDEIYTGFGRTGRWFACEHSGVIPDVVCLGKALTGGFPLSACVGRAEVMDRAWPASTGEAIHTSTYLGHPVGCAMALAQIGELQRRRLVERSARLGLVLGKALNRLSMQIAPGRLQARQIGLMAGIEMRTAAGKPDTALVLAVMKRALARGLIVLPEGAESEVLSLAPPLTMAQTQLLGAVRVLGRCIEECLETPAGQNVPSGSKKTQNR